MGARDTILQLYDGDSRGTWLPKLLSLPQRSGRRAAIEDLGDLTSEPKLDYQLNPPKEWLGWLIEHPKELVRPPESEWKRLQPETRVKRGELLEGNPGTRKTALALLDKNFNSLKPAWWRFEAARRADLVLLTERAVIVVEERAETPEAEFAWYPRPKVFRDLECAACFAKQSGRSFVYVLTTGEKPSVDVTAPAALEAALPHLSPEAREELASRYLGHADAVRV